MPYCRLSADLVTFPSLLLQIVPNVRERLLELFYGIYRKDSSEVRVAPGVWGVTHPHQSGGGCCSPATQLIGVWVLYAA